MSETNLLLIGRIGRSHGVRGEVKVYPETDDPDRFSDLAEILLGLTEESAKPFAIEGVRFQTGKKGVIVLLKLKEVNSRDMADTFRKQLVFARESDLPPLEDGEYFIHELIGLQVVDLHEKPLGTVKDVLDLPAHLVYLISREDAGDVMVPAVPAFIEEIDFSTQRLVLKESDMFFD